MCVAEDGRSTHSHGPARPTTMLSSPWARGMRAASILHGTVCVFVPRGGAQRDHPRPDFNEAPSSCDGPGGRTVRPNPDLPFSSLLGSAGTLRRGAEDRGRRRDGVPAVSELRWRRVSCAVVHAHPSRMMAAAKEQRRDRVWESHWDGTGRRCTPPSWPWMSALQAGAAAAVAG